MCTMSFFPSPCVITLFFPFLVLFIVEVCSVLLLLCKILYVYPEPESVFPCKEIIEGEEEERYQEKNYLLPHAKMAEEEEMIAFRKQQKALRERQLAGYRLVPRGADVRTFLPFPIFRGLLRPFPSLPSPKQERNRKSKY